jgi:hypothetical protein
MVKNHTQAWTRLWEHRRELQFLSHFKPRWKFNMGQTHQTNRFFFSIINPPSSTIIDPWAVPSSNPPLLHSPALCTWPSHSKVSKASCLSTCTTNLSFQFTWTYIILGEQWWETWECQEAHIPSYAACYPPAPVLTLTTDNGDDITTHKWDERLLGRKGMITGEHSEVQPTRYVVRCFPCPTTDLMIDGVKATIKSDLPPCLWATAHRVDCGC